MIILTTFNLRPWIGKRVVLNELRAFSRSNRGGQGGRPGRVSLENQHGIFDGPIFVLRELTREEYQSQLEAELGRPLRGPEIVPMRQYRTKYFDISVD